MTKVIWNHTNVFMVECCWLNHERWIRSRNCYWGPFCALSFSIIGSEVAKRAVGSRNIRSSKMGISIRYMTSISLNTIKNFISMEPNRYLQFRTSNFLSNERISHSLFTVCKIHLYYNFSINIFSYII